MDRSSYNGGSGGAGRGRGGGGGRGGGSGRGGCQRQHQSGGGRGRGGGKGQYQGGGGERGGCWGASPTGTNPPMGHQRGYRPVQAQGGAYIPPHARQGVELSSPVSGESRGVGGGGAWSTPVKGRGWATTSVPGQSQTTPQPLPDPVIPDIQSLKVSDQQPLSSLQSTDDKFWPMKRPDSGCTLAVRSIKLHVNHFPVTFNADTTIMHYDVDVKQQMSPSCRSVRKSDLRLIRDKLFSDDPERFPLQMTAYDGEKSIFSAVRLPTGQFKVELSGGEGTKACSYVFTIKLVNELKLSKLEDYLSGNLLNIPRPRDILQGMDLVMKENPSRNRISVGRSFYSREFNRRDDLRCGVAAFRGFRQSLKPTSQGLALCLDYSVLAFRKQLPVIDYLKENVLGFNGVEDMKSLRKEVISALRGLKVMVTHRVTKQKYTIAGLSNENTRDISLTLEDPEGNVPSTKVDLVDYFKGKYGKEIMYMDIPCLDLGKNNRRNDVPMEFCILVEGQRYPKEHLDKDTSRFLKKISLPFSKERKNTICEMVRAEDGPCGGDFTQSFEMGVEKNMTTAVGRILDPPALKLGTPNVVRVNKDKCQWNLVGKSVVEGKPVERWALIDFSYHSFLRSKLNSRGFIQKLRSRCKNMGIRMEEPVVCRFTGMGEFSNVHRIERLLESVIMEAKEKCQGQLQIIVCVMTAMNDGFKFLKWVSETRIGVLTQCCLSTNANKEDDQILTNLALKINAKLGGSNVELIERLPCFEGEDHVMFVGADVNHPGAWNSTCPSIAAVVATVNWPAANRYAARVCPQSHRTEKILNLGTMCLDLINTYARHNKVKPKRIVFFRDGVSESQFNMVLNEELLDLRRAIYEEHYRPTITLVLAQKRHTTRLFLQNERDGGSSGNVPPGTVVDSTIIHPFEFDFYLCSHYGSIGTSKPTHYYVLHDEHNFTSSQLQQLIYNLCFTFARCTKPVSLVPPVYYADLVAYRGRMFQEVVMELQSPDSASSSSSAESSSSSSSSSSSAASFDESFYKLHPGLQDVMFFV